MTIVQFRQKCKTCPRTYIPDDLRIAGLCPVCMEQRSWAMDEKFLAAIAESKRRSDGHGYACFECPTKHMLSGFIHWDVGAQEFFLLCRVCKSKAVQSAAQYRGTQYGYAQKAY